MKIIGNGNLSQIEWLLLCIKMGYKVFLPKAYYNGVSYLKVGCPLWLQTHPNGDCLVFEITNERTWDAELEDYIIRNFPPMTIENEDKE